MFGRQGCRCERCGACCRNLIVEAQVLDVLREPLIAERGTRLDGRGTLPPDEWAWSLSAGGACPFLVDTTARADAQARTACEIYPTRPNDCVGFEPGSDACCRARAAAGLLPLRPIDQLKALGIPPSLFGGPNSNYPAGRAHR